MAPMTIATVTFEADMRLTVLQALSLDRLFPTEEIAEYILVLNDPDPVELEGELRDHLTGRISEALMSKTRFLPAVEVAALAPMRAWRSQQVLKLELASQVATEHYLLLDAKNHFVRPTTTAEFWHGERIRTYVKDRPQWRQWVLDSFEALGVTPTEDQLARPWPTTTPYLMITGEVRALLKRIESQHGAPFSTVFPDLGSATEFFLYYAHMIDVYADDPPYTAAPPIVAALFRKWPQDSVAVMEVLDDATGGDIPVFGLHRLRVPALTPSQREAIESLWRAHLLSADDDPAWFLGEVPLPTPARPIPAIKRLLGKQKTKTSQRLLGRDDHPDH
jgi:Family of unknown function (DUF6492)